jgi:hypothetical protein
MQLWFFGVRFLKNPHLVHADVIVETILLTATTTTIMRKDSGNVQKQLVQGVVAFIAFVLNIVFIPSVNSISVAVKSCMSRTEATQMLNTFVLPTTDKGTRIQLSSSWNRNSQLSTMVETKNNTHPVPMAGNDPILYDTYGEFPLHSLDILLDRVEELRSSSIDSQLLQGPPRRTKVVDLGSGCGRLALYMALTVGKQNPVTPVSDTGAVACTEAPSYLSTTTTNKDSLNVNTSHSIEKYPEDNNI